MKIKREVKIGFVSIAALVLLFWGVNFLKGKKIFSRHITFYTVLDETRGLASTNIITLNGIKIGQVDRVFFHPDRSGRVLVRSVIENLRINIPANSVALVRKPALVGEIEIAIKLGDSPTTLQNGDTLASFFVPSLVDDISLQISPIKEKLENLILQVDSVFSDLNKMLDKKNIESISKSLENLSLITQSLAKSTPKIDGLLVNGEQIMVDLRKSSNEVSVATRNFSTISTQLVEANLGQTLNDASKSIKSFNDLLEKIQTSEGSLNLLIQDKDLYNNLKQSTRQLELLLEDVRKNPRRYINFSVF